MENTHQEDRFPPRVPKLFQDIYKFLLQFLLPLLALGPLMYGAEKLAELFGFHGTGTQFIRMIMLGVYVLVAFAILRPKTSKPDKRQKNQMRHS